MTTTRIPARRRRARRGSLERPVNARLYRASFLVVAIPLLLLAFSSSRPGVLATPQLPPNFDGPGARSLADEIAASYPDRAPGSAGAIGAATWLRDQFRTFGLPVAEDSWRQREPGGPVVKLVNIWAVAAGRSPTAIVVLAHRDDTGVGPGANDNGSGTAALIELARGYTVTGSSNGGSVRPAHTIVFLSTDGGATGGLGAARFAKQLPFPVAAVVNLTAIAGRGAPRLLLSGDSPRSATALLVSTAARRIAEQSRRPAQRASVLGQLIDLGFPFTLGEQGPFVARGIPAVTITTDGERPVDAFTDRAKSLDAARLTALGRAAEELVGSIDQGGELTGGTPSFVWVGGRVVRGWAIQLLLFSLLAPFLVTVVDLFAHCRRRGVRLAPALRSLRRRAGFWLAAGLSYLVFDLVGAWPRGPARPPNPATPSTGDWSVLPLVLLIALVVTAWLVARRRLVPRGAVSPEEQLAGSVAALLGGGVVAVLVLAANPFALLFCLPALHAWLWLPQVQSRSLPIRAAIFAVGLAGPALVLLSLAIRFGLGFDAPWYLLELTALGYVKLTSLGIVLLGAACAGQLAAVGAGRYAPYPPRRGRSGAVRALARYAAR